MITDSSSLKRMFGSSEKGATKVRKISNRYTRKVFLNKLVELGKLFWPGHEQINYGQTQLSLFRALFRVSQACITLPTQVFAEGGKVSLFKRAI